MNKKILLNKYKFINKNCNKRKKEIINKDCKNKLCKIIYIINSLNNYN